MIFETAASVRISTPASRAAPAMASEIAPVPPRDEAPRSERAVDLAHVVMEEHVRGAGRAHAEERPDDAGSRHRGLEHVGLEPLIEEVHGAHRHELDLVVLVLVAQRLKAAAEVHQVHQPARIERGGIRRGHVQDRLDEPSHLDHRLAVLVVRFGVDPRMPRDLPARLRVIVHAPQIIAARHRRERAVERQNLEAVLRQVELADDLGPQQRHDVRAHRVLEAGVDLLGHRRAAEHVAALEHQHLPAGAREVRRAHQPVVAAANHDDVVVGHSRVRNRCASRRITDFV